MQRSGFRRSGSKRSVWHARERRRKPRPKPAVPAVAVVVLPAPAMIPAARGAWGLGERWRSGDPAGMIADVLHVANNPRLAFHLPRYAVERKLRLFYCACFRACAPPGWGRNLADVIERYADGRAFRRDLDRAHREALRARAAEREADRLAGRGWYAESTSGANLLITAAYVHRTMRRTWATSASPAPPPAQVALLHELFGDPFDPVAVDPRWRTGNVLALARRIDRERAFDLFPILADALMDAGCADDAVLGHCRGDGPHAHGCWLIDGLLGRV